jgi:phosphoribosylamine--glycine ligase/phosphoribosylglycinamide formyltransferase/phosphoribosylformylglycinamidine cyclo-ligase
LNQTKIGPKRLWIRTKYQQRDGKRLMMLHKPKTLSTSQFPNYFNMSLQLNCFSAEFAALVVKASGLAAGKGVVVAANKQQACDAVDEILTQQKFGTAGETVVIEELLEGEEVSVLAFCDGNVVKPMLPAQDHKRILDNDQGPNTGGMGAYCPCPLLSQEQFEFVQNNVLQRVVNGFKKEKIKFVGV